VSIADPTDKKQRAMWGTTRALLNNSILGVTEGFTVPVRFVGVGYRAQLDGDVLSLKLGYKDPIVLSVPSGVTVQVVNPTRLMLSGVDLQQMTQFAATIRKWRPPEPYNQKGVFVGTETIRKKVGKKK
jgi:large subunit ribosomal protein L6